MRTRNEIGRLGEDIAVAHRETGGFQVLDRNWFGPTPVEHETIKTARVALAA